MLAGRETNFHSFRHSFIADACRRAEVLDAEIGTIVGHSNQSTATTRGYGRLNQAATVKRRAETINAVEFPGLDLSHLYVIETLPAKKIA